MPECQNCGSHTTERYQRVMEPPDVDGVRCCPRCPDLVRRDGEVRGAKAFSGVKEKRVE